MIQATKKICFLILGLLLASCGSVSKEAHVNHTLNKPVNHDKHNALWLKIGADDYLEKDFKGQYFLKKAQPLSLDHPSVKRAQKILNNIFSYLSQTYPLDMTSIPKPEAVVYQVGSQFNASVGSVDRFVTIPIFYSEESIADFDPQFDLNPHASDYLKIPDSVESNDMNGGDNEPVPSINITADIAERIDAELKAHKCKISWEYDDQGSPTKGIMSDECEHYPSAEIKKRGFYLGIKMSFIPSIVEMSSYLIDSLKNDDELTAILAHELAHYIKAHQMTKEPYGYLYLNEGAVNLAEKPIHDPRYDEQLESALYSADLVYGESVENYQLREFGYHSFLARAMPYLTDVMASLKCSGQSTNENSCSQSCQTLIELNRDPHMSDSLHNYNIEDPGVFSEFAGNYQRVFKKCMQNIILDQEFKSAVSQGIYDEDTYKKYPALNYYILEALAYEEDDLASIADQYEIYSAELNENIKAQTAAYQEQIQDIVSANLGYYTIEQEADELALEWLMGMKISPDAMIKTLIASQKAWDNDPMSSAIANILPPELETPFSTCMELYKNDWMSGGEVVQIPLGSVFDEHHSGCYRIYNIDREIKTHFANDQLAL